MSIAYGGDSITFADGSVNASGFMGFKNRIINGQMQIAQRANSATITAAATIANSYSTVDRFYVYCTGANVTAAQVAGSGATKNRLQITGNTSVTAVGIGQRIEANNSYDLANSICTLSADLAISSTLTTVTWTASYANTADTFGTVSSNTNTQIATGTFTVSPTVTRFSTNISIPAAATTGIQILFTVGALTSGLTWTIGNVQLERGSTASSFEYRSYGTELALCQRYYYRNFPAATNKTFCMSFNSTTVLAYGYLQFPVSMRTSPTALEQSGTANNYLIAYLATSTTCSAVPTFVFASPDGATIAATVASGLTAGQGSQIRADATNGATAYLGWSAEL